MSLDLVDGPRDIEKNLMTQSQQLFQRAQYSIPGGVNSPVRAFKGVGGTPLFFQRAQGAYLVDVDENYYIDYVGSWGPAIVGHAHPQVIAAVQQAIINGLSFGAPTEIEIMLAEKICQLMPAIRSIRMVNSGTEATMTALRLARAFTGRNKILKFEGCYHGHADSLLIKAGSGSLTFGVPSSPGVPPTLAQDTLNAIYNDLDSVETLFKQHNDQIAAIIVEPVAGNMNCVPPVDGFLAGLRALCDQHGTVLIFDEVMTGFRVALGGAQAYYGVTPDLTTLGKVIGGGIPVGAVGGRQDIMQQLSPQGTVYQAGTLSGNPIAMTAGLTTLQLIEQPDFHTALSKRTEQLTEGLQQAAKVAGIALSVNAVGGLFGFFFTDSRQPIRYLSQVMACDVAQFKRFFHAMLAEGVYLAPSAYEAGFISSTHSEKEISLTLAAAEAAFAQLSCYESVE